MTVQSKIKLVKSPLNRVKIYKLNAKKAYELAAGLRDIKNGKLSSLFSYRVRRSKKKELNDQEQKVFVDNFEYGYKYATLFNKRLFIEVEKEYLNNIKNIKSNMKFAIKYCCKFKVRLETEVESAFLQNVDSDEEVKIAIKYCEIFELILPSCLHNKIILQTAIQTDSNGLNRYQRSQKRITDKVRKKYLIKFQRQKKDFLIFVQGLMKDNNLSKQNTIGELINTISSE